MCTLFCALVLNYVLAFTDANVDLDADFVYDYHTLRVGGLVFAGVIVFLSVIMLAGNKLLNCGKSKVSVTEFHWNTGHL
uniref:FXYD domain-containing ion transport regulator n=1 Tax=Periophthalmus magnuspinnatus TaxID=409849 RepID=A0A3B4A3M0_9GOBI